MLGDHDEFAAVYVISVAAEISGMHPQTLRQYDRLGLVSPDRAIGRGRRYSIRDIALLREVQRLVHEGINLAGIKRILELETRLIDLNREMDYLRAQLAGAPARRDLVPIRKTSHLVIYKKDCRRRSLPTEPGRPRSPPTLTPRARHKNRCPGDG